MDKIELNKIYNEDCLIGMQRIPDKSIDMILCDLPYGTTNCKWDEIIPFDKLWEQYDRILKPKGIVVLTATEPFTSKLIMSNVDFFKEKLIWIKHRPSNFANAKHRHMKYTEDVVVFGESGTTYNRQMVPRTSPRVKQMHDTAYVLTHGGKSEVSFGTIHKPTDSKKYDANYKNPTDYLEFPAVLGNSKEKTKHPTQKPLKLFEYLIKTYSNEGDTVLDNCMGSGTTAEACINTRRKFIGFELDEEYFRVASDRVEKAQSRGVVVDG